MFVAEFISDDECGEAMLFEAAMLRGGVSRFDEGERKG